jgi:hypothetical protein
MMNRCSLNRLRIAVIVIAITSLASTTWAACPDFGSAVNYSAGTSVISVAIGDFNRDGKPDLAVANYTTNNVSILLWSPHVPGWAAPVNYSAGTNPYSVAIGDFNHDGKLDLQFRQCVDPARERERHFRGGAQLRRRHQSRFRCDRGLQR